MWKFAIVVLVLGLSLLLIYWKTSGKDAQPKLTLPSESHVLLIVADSLMPEPLATLMNKGELPALSFLRDQGFITELASVFPTMSVVNDSSLLTGSYPDEHGIPGLVWFKHDENRFVDYGDAMGNIVRRGVLKVAKDGVFNLNDEHLSTNVETIHETLAKQNISTASINLMVRRGHDRHQLRFPFNRLVGDTPISGPHELRYGYFLKEGARQFPLPWNKYGYGTEQVEKMTLDIMGQPNPPRLVVTYLSEPDKVIHKKGPTVTEPLYEIDRFIQNILDAFPSWKEALTKWRIIVMGDSGQAPVLNDERQALISIPNLLSHYVLRGLSKAPSDAELAVATNERMAYLYPLKPLDLEQLANRVVTDSRIDLVAYLNAHENVQVHTANGSLQFNKGGTYADPYGQKWEVNGDPAVLDVQQKEDGHWEYGAYKDLFRQLYAAVHVQPSAIVVTAHSGYEFQYENSPTHVGGGSHGGITAQEMTVPLVVGGTNLRPKHDRLVDMKQYLIDCLERPME